MGQLAADSELKRYPLPRERELELGHAIRQLGHVRHVSGPDVRGGYRQRGAVRDGVGGECERLAQIGRAVVHARQHV